MNESPLPRLSTTRSQSDMSSAQPAPNSTLSNQVTSPLSTSRKKTLRDHIKTCLVHNVSASKTEWQRQKDQDNASNPAIDKIMEMIGLEEVKSQVLRIKSKVDTSVRQGTDLKNERLGLVLLGNPGTGQISPLFQVSPRLTPSRQNDCRQTLRKGLDIPSSTFWRRVC